MEAAIEEHDPETESFHRAMRSIQYAMQYPHTPVRMGSIHSSYRREDSRVFQGNDDGGAEEINDDSSDTSSEANLNDLMAVDSNHLSTLEGGVDMQRETFMAQMRRQINETEESTGVLYDELVHGSQSLYHSPPLTLASPTQSHHSNVNVSTTTNVSRPNSYRQRRNAIGGSIPLYLHGSSRGNNSYNTTTGAEEDYSGSSRRSNDSSGGASNGHNSVGVIDTSTSAGSTRGGLVHSNSIDMLSTSTVNAVVSAAMTSFSFLNPRSSSNISSRVAEQTEVVTRNDITSSEDEIDVNNPHN